MHVPRFWVKETAAAQDGGGQPIKVGCWGWSESSVDEARTRALQSAKRLAQRLLDGDELPPHYWYDQRLPREEIIDEYEDDQGQTRAFVSRNSYGAVILNTHELMFIDVDLPANHRRGGILPKFLSRMFGGTEPPDPATTLGESIRATAKTHHDLGFRVYRTHSGFRVMVTNRAIAAQSQQASDLLDQFKADPLYIRMCKNQQCYRARLTPKAWRCHLGAPPSRFPFANAEAEAANRNWEQSYHDTIAKFRTCQLVESIGNQDRHPAIADLIELHDKLCKVDSQDPLA